MMFLLAKRDNKKTKVVVDKFIKILNNHLSNPSFKSTERNEKLIRQVCNCLVYNLAKTVPYKQNNTQESLDELCQIITNFIDKLPVSKSKILNLGIFFSES